jgi:hypothetical protein
MEQSTTQVQKKQSQRKVDLNKSKFTIKDYKAKRDEINALADKMPVVCQQEFIHVKIPGHTLINQGITFLPELNERVQLDKFYLQTQTKHVVVDHRKEFKRIFMDRGLLGIHNYISNLPKYIEDQKKKYPELYDDDKSGGKSGGKNKK